MTFGDIARFFDGYNRTARIYPALIMLAPIAWTAAVFFPDIEFSFKKGSAAVIVLACIAYLFATFTRARGKVFEARLLELWGGFPTTAFLRHRDDTIDAVTKKRYKENLSRMCDGLKFPTPEEELASTEDADAIYRSATKRLIEARRDSMYKLLHEENASYGFRRNLLGVKSIAISLALISIVIVLGVLWYSAPNPMGWHDFAPLVKAEAHVILAILISVAYVIFFVFAVTPLFVHQAASEYAVALFRTLDGEPDSRDPRARPAIAKKPKAQ